MAWYGQSKPPEDQIAAAVFGDYVGTCVEVGAYNGIDLSNTYHFYLKGWRCINFEPHPENYAALCVNQPKAINVQAAAGLLDDGLMELKTAPGKPIVTGANLPDWYVRSEVPGGWGGLALMPVVERTVESVLSEHGIEQIDLLSVDTDGTELDVLMGVNLTRYRPRLIIAEYNTSLGLMVNWLSTTGGLLQSGYHLAHDNGLNGFWTRTQADFDAVRRAVR